MIENIQTKRRYIGSTVNIKKRLKLHDRCIRHGYSINRKIDEDIDAGFTNFFFCVLATFEDNTITNRQLSAIEHQFIVDYGTEQEYNYHGACARMRLDDEQLLCSSHNISSDQNRRHKNGEKESR